MTARFREKAPVASGVTDSALLASPENPANGAMAAKLGCELWLGRRRDFCGGVGFGGGVEDGDTPVFEFELLLLSPSFREDIGSMLSIVLQGTAGQPQPFEHTLRFCLALSFPCR